MCNYYTKIQGPRFERNYIIARDKNVMKTWCVISNIAENKLDAHHETHLHTIKAVQTHTLTQTRKVRRQGERSKGDREQFASLDFWITD